MKRSSGIHTNLQATLADLRGDDAALRLLAGKFVKRYPEYVSALSSAFQDKDIRRLAEQTHKLRGALGIFHARRALGIADAIERKTRHDDSLPDEEFIRFLDELDGIAKDLAIYLGDPE